MSNKKKNNPDSDEEKVLAYTTNPSGYNPFEGLSNPDKSKEKKKDYPVRIKLEKKGRGGKIVSIVSGLKVNPDHLEDIAKDLKSKCGTGGTSKNGEIIIQGDHRDKMIEILLKKGYSNVKKSGG
nr:translation initiation factor [Saprospiraceae bacterium]